VRLGVTTAAAAVKRQFDAEVNAKARVMDGGRIAEREIAAIGPPQLAQMINK
jgi:hypothetical protein